MMSDSSTRFFFDGCSCFPNRLLGVEYGDLCFEHDGCDIDHYYETGEQRPRKGPSYVNGGSLKHKVRDDLLLMYHLWIRGLTGEREWYWWYFQPLWLVIPMIVFVGVSVFGLPWAPKIIAKMLNRGIDFRWGKVRPKQF